MIPTDQFISLEVRRVFAAPRERIFRAWTEPAALQQWFRPGGRQVIVRLLEPRVGGRFEFESQAADGKHNLTTGKFLEIAFPEKIVFTWIGLVGSNQETRVTVEFFERGDSTEVILTHDRFVRGTSLTIFQQGWTSMLEHLANVIAN